MTNFIATVTFQGEARDTTIYPHANPNLGMSTQAYSYRFPTGEKLHKGHCVQKNPDGTWSPAGRDSFNNRSARLVGYWDPDTKIRSRWQK